MSTTPDTTAATIAFDSPEGIDAFMDALPRRPYTTEQTGRILTILWSTPSIDRLVEKAEGMGGVLLALQGKVVDA